MEVETPINFFLSALEALVHSQLKDSEARITPSKTEGKVLLEIEEHILANYLEDLHSVNNPIQLEPVVELSNFQQKAMIIKLKAQVERVEREKKLLKPNMWKPAVDVSVVNELQRSLQVAHKQLKQKSQLADDLQGKLEQEKMEKDTILHDFKKWRKLQVESKTSYELELESYLAQAEQSLKLQTSTANVLQMQLKHMKGEKVALQHKLQAMTSQLHAEKQSALEEAKETLEAYQASMQIQLEKQRAQTDKLSAALERQKASHVAQLQTAMKTLECSQASHHVQVEQQRAETERISAALNKAEQELKSGQLQWEEDKSSLIAQLEKSRSTHLAQLEMQEKDNQHVLASLKRKMEDQLQTSQLQWQQEKIHLLNDFHASRASYLAQLDEQKQGKSTLEAALREAELDLQSLRIEWQGEETSLLQANESAKQALQDKELQYEDVKSHLEDLQSQVKKKKKNWLKRIFSPPKSV